MQDRCYHGGAFFEAIGPQFDRLERRHRVINADVLDAWFPPAPRVLEALTADLPWLLRTSPPTHNEGLIQTIARVRGVPEAVLLAGAGSSDLIFLALREWLHRDSRVLILDPMYGEYAHLLEKIVACHVDRLVLRRGMGFQLDPDELVAAAKRHYDWIILVNPNSPTGRHVPRAELLPALQQIPTTTRIWVDETYVEYAGPGQSLETFAATSPNVVVCKSLSKVYALSGARAAYLCGPAALIASLRPLNPPWAVSLPAQVAAVAALEDLAYYEARWQETHQLRAHLARDLESFAGWEIIPGIANFLLCLLPPDGPTAAEVVTRCRRQNLFLRDAGAMGRSLGNHALRIAVKDAQTNAAIVRGLQLAVGAPIPPEPVTLV